MPEWKELDRKIPIPLYYQLKEELRRSIENGELSAGAMIPSERELSEKFQISRPTVRQAVKELVYEGLLEREKGRGTFVVRPKLNYGFIQRFVTFHEDMAQKGYLLKTKVLELNIIPASTVLASALQIDEAEEVIFLKRIRYLEDTPLVRVVNHLPHKLCPGILNEDLNDRSLYRLLGEKYGLHPYRARITLEAVVADTIDAEELDVAKGSPIFLMKNITYSDTDKVMDYFQSRFRGDRGKVNVEVFETSVNRASKK